MMKSKRSNTRDGMHGDEETNNILYVEGLAKVTSSTVLNELFSRYLGFREVRHFPEKQVAFVEFENDDEAGMAMQAMQGNSIRENNGENTILRITFSKRG
jgi:RNA recognition motif-containing protein